MYDYLCNNHFSGGTENALLDYLVNCPKHHIVHSFLACDVHSDCFAASHQSCDYDVNVPMMTCDDGVEKVLCLKILLCTLSS